MSEPNPHCPFLNRPDARCAEHFRVDNLDHAFRHCFHRYQACEVYIDRVIERRLKGNRSEVNDSSTGDGAAKAAEAVEPSSRSVQVARRVATDCECDSAGTSFHARIVRLFQYVQSPFSDKNARG